MHVELIHPAKTGGTTVSRFLRTVSNTTVHAHETRLTRAKVNARPDVHYILPFRHPVERAVSMYKYYVAGSEMWKATRERPEPVSFDTFWTMVAKGTPPTLPKPYMWRAHLHPQMWWVGDDISLYRHPRVHVLPVGTGCPPLRESVFGVLDSLGLDYNPARWKTVNVSQYRDPIPLDSETMDMICDIYRTDMEVWNTLDVTDPV